MHRIRVSAYPVWQQAEDEQQLYYSGMRFTDLDAEAVVMIEQIIRDLSIEVSG